MIFEIRIFRQFFQRNLFAVLINATACVFFKTLLRFFANQPFAFFSTKPFVRFTMQISESFAPALFEFCGLQSVCKLLQNAKKRSISQSVRLVGKYVAQKNAPLNRERFFR